MRKILLLLPLLLLSSIPALTQTKTLMNLDKNGIAMQGYDPVAFFTQNRLVKRRPEFESKYNGGSLPFCFCGG